LKAAEINDLFFRVQKSLVLEKTGFPVEKSALPQLSVVKGLHWIRKWHGPPHKSKASLAMTFVARRA
jgi:hypothetical protein